MYELTRVNKRIPSGSIWQSRRSYLMSAVDGWTRTYGPEGTQWSNPLGGWTTEHDGVSLFHPERDYVIACIGPREARHFYIDVAHRVSIAPGLIEFVDLYLDVMIDGAGAVSEKDEHQLAELPGDLQRRARAARDEVRRLIAGGDPKFDPRSRFFAVPDDARSLPPMREALEL
jgi:hypothetical protein